MKSPEGESDYVSGLVHDVGKIVMSSVFPEHFRAIYHAPPEQQGDLVEKEKEILGMDHAELGAFYLQKQRLPEISSRSRDFIIIRKRRPATAKRWRRCRWPI